MVLRFKREGMDLHCMGYPHWELEIGFAVWKVYWVYVYGRNSLELG